MKKLLVLIALITLSGCSFGKKLPDNNLTFSLEQTIRVDEKIYSEFGGHYEILRVQDGKMLLHIYNENKDLRKVTTTKQLIGLDIYTKEAIVLKTFEEEIRVEDFALVPNGFVYIADRLDEERDENLPDDYRRYYIIENIDGVERELHSEVYYKFRYPRLSIMNDSVYFLSFSPYLESGKRRGNDIVLRKYQEGEFSKLKEIKNRSEDNVISKDSEFLVYDQLSVGKDKIGFITKTANESNNKSFIYLFDKDGSESVHEKQGSIDGIILFSIGELYVKNDYNTQNDDSRANYYSLYNDKEVVNISEPYYEIEPLGENILLYNNDDGPGILIANKTRIEAKKFIIDEHDMRDSIVFPLEENKFILLDRHDSTSWNIHVVGIK